MTADALDFGVFELEAAKIEAVRKAMIRRALRPLRDLPIPDYPWGLPETYALGYRLKLAKAVDAEDPPGWRGAPLYPHQRLAVWWLYVCGRAILADQVGVGKTNAVLGLIQLLKDFGEPHRALIVVPKTVQPQWAEEALRNTNLGVQVIAGSRDERAYRLRQAWEVGITTYPQLLRDTEHLRRLKLDVIAMDEASAFRHHETQTAERIKALARRVPRRILLDGTPIQNSLLDFHSLLETLDVNVFGSLAQFDLRYVRHQRVKRRHGARVVDEDTVVGYHHMREFKARIAPFVLRRRALEIPGMPEVAEPVNLWLELGPEQRKIYDDAKRGVVTAHQAGQRAEVRATFHHLQQAVDSTWHFGRSPGESVKIEKLIELAQGDLLGEKIVAFCHYKTTIAHCVKACRDAGVGIVRWTGDESQDERMANYRRFWDDPSVQIIIGTTALERGLNLQKAAWLVNLNQLYNPQRMGQLLGRIRRLGSEHTRVMVLNLLARDTLEERMMELLRRRAAVSDYVLEEEGDLYQSLSEEELMELIRE